MERGDPIKDKIKDDFQQRFIEIGGLPWKPLTPDEVDRKFEVLWKKHEKESDWDSQLIIYFTDLAAERQHMLSLRSDFIARYRQIGELPWKTLSPRRIDQYFLLFLKNYDKSKNSHQQLALYFSDVVTERRLMLSVRGDFSTQYLKIGGWPGETLDQKAIDERFELFWKKYKETQDWRDRFDDYFGAIQNHRQWYAQIKKEFFEWYRAHKTPLDDALSETAFDDQIEARFRHFYKAYQDSPNIRVDMQNHFASVLTWRAEKASRKTDHSIAVGADNVSLIDNESSIDIEKLIEDVTAYRDNLQSLKEKNINTAPFFWQQAANRERYLPHMIVSENLRAEEIADFMENDAFKLNLHYFDSPEDFAWALITSDGNNNFKGVVDAEGHFVYEDASTKANRTSLVGIEPAHIKIGVPTLMMFNDLLGGGADVVHNHSLSALNIQKAAMGCGYFSVTIGVDVAGAGPRNAVEVLHFKQHQDNAGHIFMYNDPLGMHFDASLYVLGQSSTQATGIVNNEKYTNRNLAESPQNKKKETFPNRNLHHRVTQKIVDADSREIVLSDFSSALDDKRIKGLNRLIECLEGLKRDHGPQKAGRLFAAYLRNVRFGLQADWDQHIALKKASNSIPNWDVSAGPAQLQELRINTPKLSENQRVELMIDIVQAIPKWQPSLRLTFLKLVNKFIDMPINAAVAPRVCDELPSIIGKLSVFANQHKAAIATRHGAAFEKWAQNELAEVLMLNTKLVSSLAAKNDGSHLAWLQRMLKPLSELSIPSLRLQLGKHLIEHVAKDCERVPYHAEHAKILLATVACVMEGWNHGPNIEENHTRLTTRFSALSSLQSTLPGFGPYDRQPNPVTEFGSMIELAVNLGLDGVKHEMASGDKWLDISSCAEKLQSKDGGWYEYSEIDDMVEQYPPHASPEDRKIIIFNFDTSRAKPAPKQSEQKETPAQIHERLEKGLTPSQKKILKRQYRNGYQLIEQPVSAQISGYRIHKEDAPAKAGHEWSALIQLHVQKQRPLIWVVKNHALGNEDRVKVENVTDNKTLITLHTQSQKQSHGKSIEIAAPHR